jgi:hypothetical protein
MWCSDIDDEDRSEMCPHGPDSKCKGCCDSMDIPSSKEEMRRQWE